MYKRLIAFLNKGSLVFGKIDQQIMQLLRLLTKFQKLSMQMNTSLEFSLYFQSIDSVNHDILISKLHFYGTRGNALFTSVIHKL